MSGILYIINFELTKYLSEKDLMKIKRLDKFHYLNFKFKVCQKTYKRKKHCYDLNRTNPYADFILANKDKALNWSDVISDNRITPQVIDAHNIPIDYKALGQNPNLNVSFLKKHKANLPENFCLENDYYCSHEITNISKEINIHFPLPLFHKDYNLEFAKKALPYLNLMANKMYVSNVCLSTGFSIHDILANADLPWEWQMVTMRKDITEKIIADNPNINWDWHQLTRTMPVSFIDMYPEKTWNWQDIYFNHGINLAFIDKYYHKNMRICQLFIKNPVLKITNDQQMILNYVFEFTALNKKELITEIFHMENLSADAKRIFLRAVNAEDLKLFLTEKHPSKEEMDFICLNKNLTFEIIEMYPDLEWIWSNIKMKLTGKLSDNFLQKNINNTKMWQYVAHYVNLDFIDQHIDLPWDWYHVANHPDINLNFVLKQTVFWDWNILSQNLPIAEILENPKLPWNWDEVSKKAQYNHVKKYPNLPWVWDEITKIRKIIKIYSN
jgi:hypothetical protein